MRQAAGNGDEPTGNLDEVNASEVLDLLLKINRLGTTVILATHAADLVNKIKKARYHH